MKSLLFFLSVFMFVTSLNALNILTKALGSALLPKDTHCATGEQCASVQYCPSGNVLVNGRCEIQTGVSAGARASGLSHTGGIRGTTQHSSIFSSPAVLPPPAPEIVPEPRYQAIWDRCIKDPNNPPIHPNMAGLVPKLKDWCAAMFNLLQSEGYLPAMDPVTFNVVAMDRQGKMYKVGDTSIVSKQFLILTPL